MAKLRAGHSPKAKTASSTRAKAFCAEVARHGRYAKMGISPPGRNHSRQKVFRKAKNLKNLDCRRFPRRKLDWDGTTRYYFSGTEKSWFEGLPEEDTECLSVPSFFGANRIVGPKNSKPVGVVDEDNFLLALLPPATRRGSIFKGSTPKLLDELLSQRNFLGCSTRSAGKLPVSTEEGPDYYACVGPKCTRNGRGTLDLTKAKMGPKHSNELYRLIKQGEEIMKSFLDPNYIKSQKDMRKLYKVPGLKGTNKKRKAGETELFSNVAFGLNTCLPAHVDEDCVLSITTVCDSKPNPSCSEVLAYFCFPESNFAVELRHGDCLIFDPLVKHCISAKIVTRDIYCLSFYSKTALTGGNDNSKELNEAQMEHSADVLGWFPGQV